MRILFTQEVIVDLAPLPKSCYGQVNLRHTDKGLEYYFAKGRESDLPDEIAERYLDQKQAEIVAKRVIIRAPHPDDAAGKVIL